MSDKKPNIFTRLKQLFDKSIIYRETNSGRLRIYDPNKLQSVGNSSLKRSSNHFSNVYRSDMRFDIDNSIDPDTEFNRRLSIYTDYEIMDTDPIISSALDIYCDECLGKNTLIPLLNGDKKTIEELYKQKYQDFWVYGLDKEGKFSPTKVERVAYNGIKKVKKITLEDGTEIFATDNHMWKNSKGELVYTQDLNVGDGIYALKTKLSNSKSMKNYELIQTDNKFEFTHRLVGNKEASLKSQKYNFKQPVLHHVTFNKRNNDPNHLEYMEKQDHIILHSNVNDKMWKKRKADNHWMKNWKDKIKKAQSKYWTDENRIIKSNSQKNINKKFYKALSPEDRKQLQGRRGDKNGMWKNGYKIEGDKNGRWLSAIDRANEVDYINILEIVEKEYIPNMSFMRLLKEKQYNFNRSEFMALCNKLCETYNVDTIKQIPKKINITNNKHKLHELKQLILESDDNPYRNFTKFCNRLNISPKHMNELILEVGYKNYSEYVSSNNHKIIDISNDYIEMDVYDLVNVANENHLYAIESNDGSKLYTHNCTTKDEFGDMLTITSNDEDIKDELNNLFYNILDIDFNLWFWIRNMFKFGNFYLGLEIKDNMGIVGAVPLSTYLTVRDDNYIDEEYTNPDELNDIHYSTIFRIMSNDLTHNSYSHTTKKQDDLVFNEYEIIHFRMLGDTNYLPYGKSILEGARKLYKQLSLLKDAMLLHRIMRAPEKKLFRIDVGNLDDADIDTFMNTIIQKMKKIPFVDPQTGEYNLHYNLQNMNEDYFMPVRGDNDGSRIETVEGTQYEMTEELEQLRHELFAALKIPKAFLGYEEAVEGRGTLAMMDVRFARTIDRAQKIILDSLTKAAIIHLYAKGINPEKLLSFELRLTNPSLVYEQEKLEVLASKISLISDMKDLKMIPRDYMYEKILGLSEQEIIEFREGSIDDIKLLFREEQIESEGNDPKITKESYGTSADVAMLHVARKNEVGAPEGGQEGAGRPRNISKYGTHDGAQGRDPLRKKDIRKVWDDYETSINNKYKRGSNIKEEVNINSSKLYKRKRLLEGLKIDLKNIYKNVITSDKKKQLIREGVKREEAVRRQMVNTKEGDDFIKRMNSFLKNTFMDEKNL